MFGDVVIGNQTEGVGDSDLPSVERRHRNDTEVEQAAFFHGSGGQGNCSISIHSIVLVEFDGDTGRFVSESVS